MLHNASNTIALEEESYPPLSAFLCLGYKTKRINLYNAQYELLVALINQEYADIIHEKRWYYYRQASHSNAERVELLTTQYAQDMETIIHMISHTPCPIMTIAHNLLEPKSPQKFGRSPGKSVVTD